MVIVRNPTAIEINPNWPLFEPREILLLLLTAELAVGETEALLPLAWLAFTQSEYQGNCLAIVAN